MKTFALLTVLYWSDHKYTNIIFIVINEHNNFLIKNDDLSTIKIMYILLVIKWNKEDPLFLIKMMMTFKYLFA